MNHKLLIFSVLSIAAISCAKELENESSLGGNDVVEVCLTSDTKATISDVGFAWQEGDVIKWISDSGSETPYTLTASDIVDGNTAKFKATIPGISTSDVKGYFSYNTLADGKVSFSTGSLVAGVLTVNQEAAGKINPANLFLFSSNGYITLPKGSTNVDLPMHIVGNVIDFKPYTAKYNSEKVTAISIKSDRRVCGTVKYNHSTGTSGSVSGNTTKTYCVSLTKPFSLKNVKSKDESSSVYFSLPVISFYDYDVIVETADATYTKAGPDWTLVENTVSVYPFNLDNATRVAKTRVTGVSLSSSSLSIAVGKTATLKAIITPTDAANKNVSWSSSNSSVATVSSDGLVTALKVGTATITVTTEDGGKTATCPVTVTATAEYPTGVTVVQNAAENYAYAIIDFNANPKLRFNVSFIDGGAQLSTHFSNFTMNHPTKGTPLIMTNADIFFKWEGHLYSCNVVMSGGEMLRYPAWADGDYYPVRSALGQNSDGSFEINWVRGGGTTGPNVSTFYKYDAPIKYTDPVAADNAEGTSRTWWWPTEAIGCSPHMVVDGKNVCKKYYDLECASFNGGTSDTYKTAKTMYGFRSDGSMVILVEWYLTLSQAADRMIELGCVTAVNFDGGGSSEMLGLGGKKLQAQTDASERYIPSAICISEAK